MSTPFLPSSKKNMASSFSQLLTRQYQNHDILSRRKKFHHLEQPFINLQDEIFARLNKERSYIMLDVGCGNGDLIIDLAEKGIKGTFFGIDQSGGMVAAAQSAASEKNIPFTATVDRAEALPFHDNTFDVVITKYALHCIEDISAALKEIYRVLKPGGQFLVITRSERSQVNFDALLHELSQKFGLSLVPNLWRRCTIEMVPGLTPQFSHHTVSFLESTIRVTDIAPFRDYLDTYRTYFDPNPSDELWQKILDEGCARVQKMIDENGVYEQPVAHGICICHK